MSAMNSSAPVMARFLHTAARSFTWGVHTYNIGLTGTGTCAHYGKKSPLFMVYVPVYARARARVGHVSSCCSRLTDKTQCNSCIMSSFLVDSLVLQFAANGSSFAFQLDWMKSLFVWLPTGVSVLSGAAFSISLKPIDCVAGTPLVELLREVW